MRENKNREWRAARQVTQERVTTDELMAAIHEAGHKSAPDLGQLHRHKWNRASTALDRGDTKPTPTSLSITAVIGDDVLRASRGPTVRLRVPAKSAPLTGGVRLSFQAHNVPLADKDGYIWLDSSILGPTSHC